MNHRFRIKISIPVILLVAAACILPFTIMSSIFGFIPPPVSFFGVLAGLVIGYLVLVELVKRWFYCRYSSFIDRRTTDPITHVTVKTGDRGWQEYR